MRLAFDILSETVYNCALLPMVGLLRDCLFCYGVMLVQYFLRNSLVCLSLSLALSACNTPPSPAPVKPVVAVKKTSPPQPQPFENGVISVPVSPVQTLPSDW